MKIWYPVLKSVHFSVLLLIMSIASASFDSICTAKRPWNFIEQFAPRATCIKHHILRAYSRCSMWYDSPFIENIKMNPIKYGYKVDKGENLVLTIMTEPSILVAFSIPFNYSKCSQPGVCLCKRRQIVCCRYQKC